MTIEKAIKSIAARWNDLPKEKKGGGFFNNSGGIEAVWIVTSDREVDYGIDEENIGVLEDGSLVWAYASGCSCWDGDYDHRPIPDLKVFKFEHKSLTDKWKESIIAFAEKMETDPSPVDLVEKYDWE